MLHFSINKQITANKQTNKQKLKNNKETKKQRNENENLIKK